MPGILACRTSPRPPRPPKSALNAQSAAYFSPARDSEKEWVNFRVKCYLELRGLSPFTTTGWRYGGCVGGSSCFGDRYGCPMGTIPSIMSKQPCLNPVLGFCVRSIDMFFYPGCNLIDIQLAFRRFNHELIFFIFGCLNIKAFIHQH